MPKLSDKTLKTTPLSTDKLVLVDVADANALKTALISALPGGGSSDFGDAVYYVEQGSNISAALQAALDAAAAAGGGVVWVGPGISLTDPVTVHTNVTLRGSGRMATTLRPRLSSYAADTYLISCEDISEPRDSRDLIVRDLYIDGQNATNLGGIHFDNEGASGDTRHRIIDCNIRYFRESGGNPAILWGHHARDGLIYGVDCRDTSIGLSCEGSDFTVALSVFAGSRDGPNVQILSTPNVRVIGVKGFYAGYDYGNGNRFDYPNFVVYGSRNTAFVGCESQDAGGHGFQVGDLTGALSCSDVTLSGCISEASNAVALGRDAYHISNASRVTLVGAISKNTIGLSGQQDYGIGLSGTLTDIDLTAAGSQQGTLGTIEATVPTSGVKVRLTGSATYNPPSLTAGTQTTTTVTVTGAKLANACTVLFGFSNSLQGIALTGYLSADNTATAIFRNGTTGTLDLASGTLWAEVWRH